MKCNINCDKLDTLKTLLAKDSIIQSHLAIVWRRLMIRFHGVQLSIYLIDQWQGRQHSRKEVLTLDREHDCVFFFFILSLFFGYMNPICRQKISFLVVIFHWQLRVMVYPSSLDGIHRYLIPYRSVLPVHWSRGSSVLVCLFPLFISCLLRFLSHLFFFFSRQRLHDYVVVFSKLKWSLPDDFDLEKGKQKEIDGAKVYLHSIWDL